MAFRIALNRTQYLITSFVITTILVTNIWIFLQTLRSLGKSQEEVDVQKTKVDNVLLLSQKYLNRGEEEMAFDFVLAGELFHSYDFFLIKKNGTVLKDSSNIEGLELKDIKEDVFHQEVKTARQTIFVSKNTTGVYEIILGYFPARTPFTWENLKKVVSENILLSISCLLSIILLLFPSPMSLSTRSEAD